MNWAIIGTIILHAVELPMGSAPEPIASAHFPSRLHEYVWRNWQLVPLERMAEVVGAQPGQLLDMGKRMGLLDPLDVSEDQWRRSHITIIRRNWHILPYEQLLQLLGWDAEHMAYILREDDFLFIKLGSLKPKCEPLQFAEPDAAARAREDAIAAWVRETFPEGAGKTEEPLFGFLKKLAEMPKDTGREPVKSRFSPRYCYSYFALYGDTLLEPEANPYPEGYLAQLAQAGVSGVWLQGVLFKLHPFPWDPALSEHCEERLANLRDMVARAKKHGIGIYMYLNEPRSMPTAFFDAHPDVKGVSEGPYTAMCTSAEPVKGFIRDAVASICREVPDLAGFFTITASENLTSCWSHYGGANCPRCAERGADVVIAEVNALIREGIDTAGSNAELIAWDWGWQDAWAEAAIRELPKNVAFMSVSEWSIPIKRGGIDTTIGEYSISTIGPGPRATRHWAIAREEGLKTLAKVQANNTWELSAVPYVPAVANVAQHAANLRESKIDGLMLSWTLGGYPSPNLEVFAELGAQENASVDDALSRVAARRFGEELAPAAVTAWKAFSAAFSEHPYTGLYAGPQQMGPANVLYAVPTGYRATMVGIPYDDLDAWRGHYPVDVYVDQYRKIAEGFDKARLAFAEAAQGVQLTEEQSGALASELDVAHVCAIHTHSVANQAEFVMARNALDSAGDAATAGPQIERIEQIVRREMELAKILYAIQARDSRFGYEASNHYYYVPLDLVEKVVNCRDLLERWLPGQRQKFGL